MSRSSPLQRRLRLFWEWPRPSRTQATLARLDAEARLSAIYPHFFARSSVAIDAHSLLLVVNDIFINAKRSVVELGAGWSTFVLASVLKESGGRLVSVEHHEGWHDLIKARLVVEGLADTVDLIHAPLTNGWYGKAALKAGLEDRGIDTLLVDGPPAKGNDIVREPALPFLFGHLAPAATIFLHDIDRKGERAIAIDWAELLDIRPRFHPDNPKLVWFPRRRGFSFKA